jgi:23S rRNA (uracil1939-C5)-methyltransferase
METRIIAIEKPAAGGYGLGRLDGQAVLVAGALAGEEMEIEILARRAGAVMARPVRVLVPHPERQEPVCPRFLDCGGCQLMHLADQAQPALKFEVLKETLAHALVAVPHPTAIRPSPQPLFYRNRVRLKVASQQGRLRLGFFAGRSRRLVALDFCHLLTPRLNELLPHLAVWLDEMAGETGAPDQIEILAGRPEEGFLLVADLPAKPSARLDKWLGAGPAVPAPVKTFYSVQGRLKIPARLDPSVAMTVLEDPVSGLRLKAGPGAFTQVNPEVNLSLVRDVAQTAREVGAEQALDLYCGLGNFTLPLARVVRYAAGFDESPHAIAGARLNQEANRLVNARFTRQRTETAVKDLAGQGRTFDLVVLDPPRSGARGLAPDLARLRPRHILYVSCHPAALARDLIELRSVGFSLKRLTAYDMFPQTAHLEVLALLARG